MKALKNSTTFFSSLFTNTGLHSLPMKAIYFLFAIFLIGCGGSSSTSPITQKPIDPSGNWELQFTDASNNKFLLGALFSQTGADVTGLNFSEVGNPANFQCAAQRDVSLANGTVQNVSQFSGTLSGNFGTIAFTSTLNNPGSKATGTYTYTPGANGNCLGIATTGSFLGDEVPSVTGSWTGSVTCNSNCPIGSSPGTISMTLTQNDSTGVVTGTYTVGGIPSLSSGSLVSDINNFISGSNFEEKLNDANGRVFFMTGGPVTALPLAGLGLDRSFNGQIVTGNSGDPVYFVTATH